MIWKTIAERVDWMRRLENLCLRYEELQLNHEFHALTNTQRQRLQGQLSYLYTAMSEMWNELNCQQQEYFATMEFTNWLPFTIKYGINTWF